MATDKPDGDLVLDLDNYDSEEDEDFQLDEDEAAEDDSGLSSSEDEDEEAAAQEQPPAKKRKLDSSSAKKDAEEDAMVLDSGDEATIQKAKQRKKARKGGKGGDSDEDDIDFDDEEEGGEGGFVKTRAMRMKMKEERKPLAKIEGATIDIDALWEKMNTPGTDCGLLPTTTNKENEEKEQEDTANGEAQPTQQKQEPKLPSEEMIKIKRTYKFAGEVITEEKLVPKDSAEAKLFLSESKDKPVDEADVDDAASKKSDLKLRRPLRKISRFDPNPTGAIKKSWEKQPAAVEADSNKQAKGPKLNTVEKSRLDWAEYVDQAGIKDELNVHSKAKEGYLGRMDFLNRVDAKREEERRRMRLKGL
ncbi:hypothetical protein VTN77DRAFT_3237 [Rasamsonia byssochlamydoides]|uniref:uncharacterized protein n=1 Tax=Rasamsonia byssochlamydoides TaxID=89139 RepID=UPI0037431467